MTNKSLNSRDHYVSQTYLKHFCSSPGFAFLHIKKVTFCKPVPIKSICYERGGDICDRFENKYGLRQILNRVEPSWNIFIQAIKNNNLIETHHLHFENQEMSFLEKICLFMAYLRALSPTMHKLEKEKRETIINKYILPLIADSNHSQLDDNSRKAIKNENIIVEIGDRNYYKAESIRILSDLPNTLYKRNWKVLRNSTNVKFITSDTPFISLINGDLYLPITPDYALIIENSFGNIISYKKVTKNDVKEYNKKIVQWASDQIISSTDDIGISKLVDKYRNYKPTNKFNSIQHDGSIILSTQHVTDLK